MNMDAVKKYALYYGSETFVYGVVGLSIITFMSRKIQVDNFYLAAKGGVIGRCIHEIFKRILQQTSLSPTYIPYFAWAASVCTGCVFIINTMTESEQTIKIKLLTLFIGYSAISGVVFQKIVVPYLPQS